MAYKYKFSSIAKNDLNKALNYISNDLCNKNASNRLLYEIYDIIDKICLFPLSFPNCSYYYVKDETIRYAIINNYYLIYKVYDDEIIFLRFKHSKQNKKM